MNSIASIMLRLYAGLSLAGLAVCMLLMGLTFALNQRLDTVLANTIAAQNAIALSRALREQYIHELHGLVYTTTSHLHHHGAWVDDAASQIRDLQARAPRRIVARAERAGQLSEELNQLFENELLPAALREDDVAVTTLHAQAHALSETAVSHADSVAAFLAKDIEEAYRGALWLARVGLALAVFGGALVLWMFVAARRRLTTSVLTPLNNFVRQADSPTSDDPNELVKLRSRLRELDEALAARRTAIVREERLAVLGKLCGRIAEVLEHDLESLSERFGELERVHHSIPNHELGILREEVRSCRRLADDLSTWRQRPSLQLERLEIASLIDVLLDRAEGTYVVDVEHCELRADRGRIRQIVLNVVRNASEVAPGGPIQVRGRIDGTRYLLQIEDRGPGVPSDMLGHVFEPFFTTRTGGTGLGLAIGRELARAHGGDLAIDNSASGAVVTLTLPIQ